MSVKDILIVLNSSNDFGFKYPIGNKELTLKVKEYEDKKLISYNSLTNKWEKTK